MEAGERRREGSHEINMRAGFSQVFPSDLFQEACLPPRLCVEREGSLRAVFHLSGCVCVCVRADRGASLLS